MENIRITLPEFNLWTIFMILLLGFMEFTLSWLNHRINIFVLGRRALEAVKLDLAANFIAEVMPFFIYVIDPNILYIIPKVVMNTLGTYVVSSRKLECPVCAEVVGVKIDPEGRKVFFNLTSGEIHKCKKKRNTTKKKKPSDTPTQGDNNGLSSNGSSLHSEG